MDLQAFHDVRQDFSFHLHAASYAKHDLEKNEIVCTTLGEIRESRIKAEILSLQFKNTLKEVVGVDTGRNESLVNGIEDHALESFGLGLPNSHGDNGHGRTGLERQESRKLYCILGRRASPSSNISL